MPGNSYNYIRLNLASAIFPFYTQAGGRTIIVPQYDENYDRYNAANTTPDKGVPQVYYMENVMPIAGGYQSIALEQELPAISISGAGVTNCDDAYTLYNAKSGGKVLFVPAGGSNYVYDLEIGSWASVSPIAAGELPVGSICTIAFWNGQSYFNYSNYGTFLYDDVTNTMIQQTLISLQDANVSGIAAACGYMLTWQGNQIAWSSLTPSATPNSIDFTPSIDTGAGGGQIQYCKGDIRFILPITGGFLIYCDDNVVQAASTNNINYPFVFKEAADSGGCQFPNLVAWGPNLDTHVAMTTNGIQSINLSQVSAILPEVDDFLASQLYETYNPTNKIFTTTFLSEQAFVKFAGVGNRFVVASYGPSEGSLTYAIIMDTTLNRYGRIQIPHVCCFNYIQPNLYNGITYNAELAAGTLYNDQLTSGVTYNGLLEDTTPYTSQKEQLAFLDATGIVTLVDFDLGNINSNGVFMIGKYQFDRNHYITHQRTVVESVNAQSQSAFECTCMYTLDGKTFQAPFPLTRNSMAGLVLQFGGRVSGQNISLLLTGAYELTSMVIEFTTGGFR